ncbi:ATP-binding protein [Dolichospermum sp. ST_con]|nr:ATP-binding protein [Dolichospermum sp. ST_con]MDD1419199.1 ATP-binding protein [Dolichospermum sp. ST_sed1]MDD1425314.1 ATP-binding protein [Dolichospermum sp. ST_sed9]MDD1431546.1 ATP-binding protein [Dolichospermum sp. ST_sed6]MDD1437441.1 ATP-binding protein [Dolichospermum sp. ST_sed10]MDD1440999.1 ATP-binding protein [Dolichospermum sp. ST_sed3]MDD1446050.1 ATP-binding protein [Dolichospermum sp. ST_sed8]MDD1455037.1 ATP-binding protein [Dolichospermum sp. ST_sed7]MDD1460938.1 ATP-
MYIRKIEIKNLWGNNFSWELNEDVNILIGKNGSGKSTILQILNEAVLPIEDSKLNFRLFDPIDEIIIALENDIVIRVDSESRSITGNRESTNYTLNTSFINTFDVVEKSLDPTLTLLDYQLDQLKLEFVTYQRDLSNQVEEAFQGNDTETRLHKLAKIEAIYEPKKIFIDIINELFSHTDKKFDEKEFHFIKTGIQTPILPKNLSSGEKQILIILLKILLQDRKEYILSMDEPEISLHIDWQRSLIKHIRQINPNCQIIITTHSPTIFYQGWIEKATRIEEIQSPVNLVTENTTIIEKTIQSEGRVQKIKSDFRNFSGSGFAKLYQFNRQINAYTSFTKDECLELLNFLQENQIYPDVITFITIISKLNNYPDAKYIFDLIEAETYTKLSHVKPNDITLNTLIKKVKKVEEGLELIQNISNNENLQLYPDIITFSTLLGKAEKTDEINLLEEMREYYKVKPNDIYLNKLKFKK